MNCLLTVFSFQCWLEYPLLLTIQNNLAWWKYGCNKKLQHEHYFTCLFYHNFALPYLFLRLGLNESIAWSKYGMDGFVILHPVSCKRSLYYNVTWKCMIFNSQMFELFNLGMVVQKCHTNIYKKMNRWFSYLGHEDMVRKSCLSNQFNRRH